MFLLTYNNLELKMSCKMNGKVKNIKFEERKLNIKGD